MTAVLALPVTVALNCCVPLTGTLAVAGDTAEIATTTGADPMVTAAVEDLVGSAADVAVTVAATGAAFASAEAAPCTVALPLPKSFSTAHVTFRV